MLSRKDTAAAIQAIAARCHITDVQDNGVSLVLSTKIEANLLDCSMQLSVYELGGMQTMHYGPSPKLFVQLPNSEISHA